MLCYAHLSALVHSPFAVSLARATWTTPKKARTSGSLISLSSVSYSVLQCEASSVTTAKEAIDDSTGFVREIIEITSTYCKYV
jgi:hypothetical protein